MGRNAIMKNRHGDEYHWEELEPHKYKFHMEGKSLGFIRYGGKKGQQGVDKSDLGMFDPSGGPYIYLGMEIFKGEFVKHIASVEGSFIVTTSECVP
tara:strand:+ start:15426 stop:15713 length:288 start_codon:yes stop_codon:yes gene_type:complete